MIVQDGNGYLFQGAKPKGLETANLCCYFQDETPEAIPWPPAHNKSTLTLRRWTLVLSGKRDGPLSFQLYPRVSVQSDTNKD